jgi:non-specific serine/threonine protein kinase
VYRVPPLDVARAHPQAPSEAEHLFADRAAAVLPGFNLVPSNAASVAEVCRQLDGIQLTTFIGRDAHLQDAVRALATCRLLTVTGPGGIGKTRFALRVGEVVRDRFKDGVWLADLAAVTDATLVVARLAEVLGIAAEAQRPLIESVVDRLRTRRRLLLLDNCEHLVEACAALADRLLSSCPEMHILATTRAWLAISGEVVRRLGPMSAPETHAQTAGEVADSEAAQLFIERAAAIDGRFVLTDGNARAIAQVCRRLDGMPLANERPLGLKCCRSNRSAVVA